MQPSRGPGLPPLARARPESLMKTGTGYKVQGTNKVHKVQGTNKVRKVQGTNKVRKVQGTNKVRKGDTQNSHKTRKANP